MNSKQLNIPELSCKRCDKTWTPRMATPRVCPKCHSPYWNQERKKSPGTEKGEQEESKAA